MATVAPAPEAEVAPKKPGRRRRRRLWLFILALPLVAVLLLVLLLVLLPRIITGERLRGELVSALTERLGVPIELGTLEYSLFSGLELGPIRVGPPPGYTRDFFTAERLAIHYDLSGLPSRRVVVQELTLDQPVLVLETKEGRRNLDAILARLGDGASAAPAEPSPTEPATPARGGPLSPITVVLEGLRIGPLTAHLVGEGPEVQAGQLLLTAQGEVGPERLQLAADLSLLAPTASANVVAKVPGPQGATEVELDFTERLQLQLAGATHDGLALEKVELSLEAALGLLRGRVAEVVLPPEKLTLQSRFVVAPAEDQAQLEGLQAELGGQPILAADGVVKGLTAVLIGQLGELPARALAAQIGLKEKRTVEDAALRLQTLSLPLDVLAPYARAFVPGLTVGGRIGVEALRVEGRIAALLAGTPPVFEGAVKFQQVHLNHPSESLKVSQLHGELLAARVEAPEPYTFGGRLELSGLVQGTNQVRSLTLMPKLALSRLAYPPPEGSEVGLAATALGIVVPGTTVAQVDLQSSVKGSSLVTPGRSEPEPIQTSVELQVAGVRVTQEKGALEVPRLELGLKAELDRLLEPTEAPIEGRLQLRLPSYRDPTGNVVTGARLSGPVALSDPRRPYFDVQADLQLEVAGIQTPAAQVEGLRLRLIPKAQRIGAQALARFFGGQPPPAKLPARANLDWVFSAERVTAGQGDDRLEARPRSEGQLAVDLLGAKAELKKFNLSLDDWLVASLTAKVDDLYDPSPDLIATTVVDRLDLAGALAHAPRSALVSAPDLTGQGQLTGRLLVRGRVPRAYAGFDLEKPPLYGRLSLAFKDVGLASATLGHQLERLTGTVEGLLEPRQVAFDAALDAGPFSTGRGESRVESEGARFEAHLGLADRLLRGVMAAHTQTLRLGGSSRDLPGAKLEADLSYPLGDDLELAKLELDLPMAGVSGKIWGRLQRQQYGVFKPDLNADLTVDVDALNTLAKSVPGLEKSVGALAQSSGRARAHLELKSRSQTRVDVHGMINLDGFSYASPGMVMERATGRVPLDQSLLLPAPEFDGVRAAAIGALGDDLEARLAELGARFKGAKAMIDKENILVVAPRTADHQALQPYFDKRGAELVIERLSYKQTVLSDVHLEGAWNSGVLRVDRFQAGVWDGYFLGDLALQLSPDLDVRMRMRGVATRLNLDIPYAQAKGVPPVTDPDEVESYRATGTLDLSFALRERAINGKIDVLQVSLPQVDRLFGALDPKGESPAVGALRISERAGVRPVAAKIWISQNLLNVQFDWQRLWVHVSYKSWRPWDLLIDTILIPGRLVLVPTLGGLYVIPLVNNAIRRLGIGNVIDSMVGGMRLEAYPALAQGWVIAKEDEEVEAVASPGP